MPVTTPSSGATITAASVTSMHEAVRAVINATTKSRFARGALGPEHLPSIVVGSDFKENTTSTTINTAPAAFQDGNTAQITTTWQALSNFDLDNGGAGYALPACTLAMFFNCRVETFATTPDADSQVWFNLHYSIDGAAQVSLLNSRVVWGNTSYLSIEESVTIWIVDVRVAAFTLNWMRVRGALNRGGSVSVPNATVPHGFIGFLALYREA